MVVYLDAKDAGLDAMEGRESWRVWYIIYLALSAESIALGFVEILSVLGHGQAALTTYLL